MYATKSIKAATNLAYKGVQEDSILEDDYILGIYQLQIRGWLKVEFVR